VTARPEEAHVRGRRSTRWRVVVVGVVLAAAGCTAAPKPSTTAEVAPIRLRHAQTGARERCGIELIREVQRANDLTWSERLFYTWTAQREARQAVEDEERWRHQCVERYRQRGYEVVSGPAQ
jgi:hypothetical protein